MTIAANNMVKLVAPLLIAAMLAFGVVGLVNAFTGADTTTGSLSEPSLIIEKHNSIPWDLDSQALAGTRYEMERCDGPGDDGQAGSVNIPQGENRIWIADEVCTHPTTFLAEQWSVRLTRDTEVGSQSYEVHLGTWSESADFVSKGLAATTIPNGATFGCVYVNCEEFTVDAGEYLALKVMTDTGITVVTKGNSWVIWPLDEPSYPGPELPTVALLGTGLMGILGYAGWRKYSKTTV